MKYVKIVSQVIWKAMITLLPVGLKKQLILAVLDWAVKSTKTKVDDKLFEAIKSKL